MSPLLSLLLKLQLERVGFLLWPVLSLSPAFGASRPNLACLSAFLSAKRTCPLPFPPLVAQNGNALKFKKLGVVNTRLGLLFIKFKYLDYVDVRLYLYRSAKNGFNTIYRKKSNFFSFNFSFKDVCRVNRKKH
jgi:hypothetical protein